MSGEMEMVRTGRVWKFGDLIKADTAKWEKVVKDAGIKME